MCGVLSRDLKQRITKIPSANDVADGVRTFGLREEDCSGRVCRKGLRVGPLNSLLTGFTRKTVRLRCLTGLSDERLEPLPVSLLVSALSRDKGENEEVA